MKRFFAIIPLLVLIACGGEVNKPATKAAYKFAPVQMPMAITDSAAQIEWSAVNYWNNTPVGDTLVLASGEIEQAFVNWLQFLNYAGADVTQKAFGALLSRTDSLPDSRSKMYSIIERYLYDPNSPMRNEDMYIVVLRHMIASPFLTDDEKIRPSQHLELALKNRVGDIAADFAYTHVNGSKGTLHNLRAPYTLIFFNNPDCTACKEITDALLASPAVNSMISSGKLKVLAMYTDNDLEAWKKFAPHIPSTWINAQNYDLHSSRQYDLKAIPTLYLLDDKKRVLLKDADFRTLISQIEAI